MLREQDYSKKLIDLIKNDDTDSVLELIKTSIDIKFRNISYLAVEKLKEEKTVFKGAHYGFQKKICLYL